MNRRQFLTISGIGLFGISKYSFSFSDENKDYEIVINKSDYLLNLFYKEKLVKSYNIELGFNPIDDKIKSGDGCTPEGEFYIAAKNPNSSFSKALLISYPNIEHAKRGLESKLITKKEYDKILNSINKKQIPPQDTELGSYIEIHGCGSGEKGNDKGKNWTIGCIALSDKDIEEIFDYIPLKTKVIIQK
mgnify:CR=1 FL=1